jgi:acyl-CoA synthetase (NDP forming)
MVNYAKGFSLPPVKGNILVAIYRSGGRAVVAADMAAAFGFDLYPFPRDFREKVKGFFRAKVIEPTNPLDLGDLFDFGIYMNILEECLKIEEVDAVLMAHTYSSLLERKGSHRLAHAVRELAARYNRHCCGTGNRSPCAPSPKARKSSPLRRPGVSYLQ